MKKQLDASKGNVHRPLSSYGLLHDSLQNHFGRIEESGRSMRKLSLYFPFMNSDILDELKEIKRRVDVLIAAFETLEQEDGESNENL